MKMAVLADWSKIKLNASKYSPVTDMLRPKGVVNQRVSDFGGISYLDSKNCLLKLLKILHKLFSAMQFIPFS